MSNPQWLAVRSGNAPLLVSFPHTGTALPPQIADDFVSPWLARKDADWWIDRLYDFAAELGATTVRTAISRSAIDVNRDPSGQSLYPGQATTDLLGGTVPMAMPGWPGARWLWTPPGTRRIAILRSPAWSSMTSR